MHNCLLNRPLRVVTYTDAAGIGGAEISLSHLVATVSDNIDVDSTWNLSACRQRDRSPSSAGITASLASNRTGFGDRPL